VEVAHPFFLAVAVFSGEGVRRDYLVKSEARELMVEFASTTRRSIREC
jgi:hypothetical protein